MVQITREIGIDYGHTLPNHFSFCNQIHGHRGRVLATVEGPVVKEQGNSSQGMVLDFKFLKEVMMKNVHDKLDHGFAVWKEDTVDKAFIIKRNKKYLLTEEPPTAEYLAKWAYYQIKPYLPKGVKLVEVQWYETPLSDAKYRETKKR